MTVRKIAKLTKSNVIVLRKTPYGESSLVIGAIAPEHGRLDFIVKGALRVERRRMPQVDLFRELAVSFREDAKGLHPLYACDIVQAFDNIAANTRNYEIAFEIANFALVNSRAMLPSPKLYTAVKNSFSILARSEPALPLLSIVKLAYLDEHGMIPAMQNVLNSAERDQTKEILDKIFSELESGRNMAIFTQKYWNSLSGWIDRLCEFHGLRT